MAKNDYRCYKKGKVDTTKNEDSSRSTKVMLWFSSYWERYKVKDYVLLRFNPMRVVTWFGKMEN